MPQNAGNSQGGINKARDKSADRHRRTEQESGARNTEEKPLDSGTRTDGGVPGSMTGGRR